MKKIIFSLLMLGVFITASAQKTMPTLKDGTVLGATVVAQGQELPLILTLKSTKAPIAFAWSVDGYGDGEFLISEKGLASGNTFYVGQPSLGQTKLSDSETWGMISLAAFKSLTDTKEFTFSGMKFKLKTDGAKPLKFGDKEIDVHHVATEDGKLELWVLNSPTLPLILQSSGLPIDIFVTDIK